VARDLQWHLDRIPSIGGTGINIAASKGDGRKKFIMQKAGEILSQTPKNSFVSWAMKRGIDFEPKARAYYEMLNFTKVQIVAMVKLDDRKHFSPDFLVGEDGFGEIKVREPEVFVQMVHDQPNLITSERRQIQWGFRIMERQWCDHIDYCPEIDVAGTMEPAIIRRFYPDPEEISKLDKACDKFLMDLYQYIAEVKK
jgi:hypothetical protein